MHSTNTEIFIEKENLMQTSSTDKVKNFHSDKICDWKKYQPNKEELKQIIYKSTIEILLEIFESKKNQFSYINESDKKKILDLKSNFYKNKKIARKITTLLGRSVIFDSICKYLYASEANFEELYNTNKEILINPFKKNNLDFIEEMIIFFTSKVDQKNCFVKKNQKNKKYFLSIFNRTIDNIFDFSYIKISDDSLKIIKILHYLSDPVLSTIIATSSLGLLSVSIYKRALNNTHNIPLAHDIALGTTIFSLSVLLSQMIDQVHNCYKMQFITHIKSHTRINFFNKKENDNHLKLEKVYENKKNKYYCYLATYAFVQFFIRGVWVNCSFQITNISSNPRAFLGISNFIGTVFFVTTNTIELYMYKCMNNSNKFINKFTDGIQQQNMKNKSTIKSNKKKLSTLLYSSSFFISLCVSLYAGSAMIINATNIDYENSNFDVYFHNNQHSQNISLNFAEKLYVSQSSDTIITIAILVFISKMFSTMAIFRKFCKNSDERRIVMSNSFRHFCGLIVLLINAFFGDVPGITDGTNLINSFGVITCAILQNSIKDIKFEYVEAQIIDNDNTKIVTRENDREPNNDLQYIEIFQQNNAPLNEVD